MPPRELPAALSETFGPLSLKCEPGPFKRLAVNAHRSEDARGVRPFLWAASLPTRAARVRRALAVQNFHAPARSRTWDLPLRRRSLCPLSYGGQKRERPA